MTTPLYLEIEARLETELLSGCIPPGQKLPTIRVLAERYRVNDGTVQRALLALRETGLVTGRRGRTMAVTSDEALILLRRRERTAALMRECIRQLRELGCTSEEIRVIIFANV